MNGILFGNKHSYKDFGLILKESSIGIPQPKLKTVDIPGADGVIDLTGENVKYKNRILTFTFTMIDAINAWASKLSAICDYLHGQSMRIVRDADQNFYYVGRVKVNTFKSNKRLATIVIECDCEPYKNEIFNDSGRWLWDSFSFVDGIIYNNYFDLSGRTEIIIVGRRKNSYLTFTASDTMTISKGEKTYTIPKGTSTNYEIVIEEGANELVVVGTGELSIMYSRGIL